MERGSGRFESPAKVNSTESLLKRSYGMLGRSGKSYRRVKYIDYDIRVDKEYMSEEKKDCSEIEQDKELNQQ